MRLYYVIVAFLVMALGGQVASLVYEWLPGNDANHAALPDRLKDWWQSTAKAQNGTAAAPANGAAVAQDNAASAAETTAQAEAEIGLGNVNPNGNTQMMLTGNNDRPLGSTGDKTSAANGNNGQNGDANKPQAANANSAANDQNANATSDDTMGNRDLVVELLRRRQDLDTRDQILQQKEALLSAAEKQLQDRQQAIEKTRDEVKVMLDSYKNSKQKAQLSVLDTYKIMKPKAAADIFNGLPLANLIVVVQGLNPRVLAPILAAMDPAKAVELTKALASNNELTATVEETKP